MTRYEPNRLEAYTDEQILLEIRRVVSEVFGGKCPKQKEFDRQSRVHSATIRDHFGSWAKAIEQAGFAPSRRALERPTNESAVAQDLNRFKEKSNGRYFSESFTSRMVDCTHQIFS